LFLIGTISSCKQDVDPSPNRKRSHKAGAREIIEDESVSYKYFFYVNGIKCERGAEYHVRSGEWFYVELRFTHPDYPETPIVMQVNRWDIPTNNIRLIRQFTPDFNNANQYEVTAPDILPYHHLNLGTITAYFTPFPNTPSHEREPVTLNLLQDAGGL
jgi:hypothetical protein